MSPTLRLKVGRDTLRADLVRRGKPVWEAEARHSGPEDLPDAFTRLVTELPAPAMPKRLVVELEPPVVQLRTLRDLPPLRTAALATLVANQATRFFRGNGKPLVTDARWGPGGRRGGVARGAAVEEAWATSIVAASRAAGLALEGIHAGPASSRPFDLLPPAVRAARRHAELISTRRVSFLLAAVWILAGGVLLLRLEVETQRMKRELSGLQESVAAVAGARRKISEAAEMVQALERSRREREALLSRLVRIGSALPDSSYLTSLALDSNGGGAITGAAREAARVVAALDQTEAAPSPRLDGPVIREVSGGRAWERFTVRFGRADQ